MPFSPIFGRVEWLLWLVVIGASAVLLARLAYTRLWRTYRFFAAYVGAQLLQSAALMTAEPGTNRYGWTYVASEFIIGICVVFATLEVYKLVLHGYVGIGRLGRRAVVWSLLLALAIAAATVLPDMGNANEEYQLLATVFVFQRAFYSALLLFVLFITAFLVWFPVPLSRNAAMHAGVFAVFFVTTAIVLLVRNAWGDGLREIVSTVYLGLYATCLLVWIFFLTLAGEKKTMVVGHRWAPEQEGRLVAKLDGINAILLRSVRK